jgi:hypothetical protein
LFLEDDGFDGARPDVEADRRGAKGGSKVHDSRSYGKGDAKPSTGGTDPENGGFTVASPGGASDEAAEK